MREKHIGEKMKEQEVETEKERKQKELSASTKEIKDSLEKINKKSEEISMRLLSKSTTKSSDTHNQALTKAVLVLKDLMPKSKSQTWLDKVTTKIPFWNKMAEDVQKTVVENQTTMETIEQIFHALDSATDEMNEDVETLSLLMDSLDDSIDHSQLLKGKVSDKLEALLSEKRPSRMEKFALESCMKTLASIELINGQTADQIEAQLTSVEALSMKITEIKPLLKGMFAIQSAVATQNARNERVQNTTEVITDAINEMIVSTNEESYKTLHNTIRQSQDQIIKETTVKQVGDQAVENSKKFKKLLSDLSQEQKKYLVTLESTNQKLKKNSLNQIAYNSDEDSAEEKPSAE